MLAIGHSEEHALDVPPGVDEATSAHERPVHFAVRSRGSAIKNDGTDGDGGHAFALVVGQFGQVIQESRHAIELVHDGLQHGEVVIRTLLLGRPVDNRHVP